MFSLPVRFTLLLLLLPALLPAQLPAVVAGRLIRHENFPSATITPRHVDVWLPEGYNSRVKYNVLYMHDGQMLFDSASTWNGQSWDVDDVISALLKENKINRVIVVAVWNGGETRHADYFPQKPFATLTEAEKERVYQAVRGTGASVFKEYKIRSDDYLHFLIRELKPFIDKTYSTNKNRSHTFIAGSSMGGLISLYALCEYPSVFGGAACLSTHWPGIFSMDDNPIPAAFFRYMEQRLPSPRTHKLYFDYGDATLDALYPPLQQEADAIMKKKGFRASNWLTRFFPGEDHSENAWRKRLHIPLTFLLGRAR